MKGINPHKFRAPYSEPQDFIDLDDRLRTGWNSFIVEHYQPDIIPLITNKYLDFYGINALAIAARLELSDNWSQLHKV